MGNDGYGDNGDDMTAVETQKADSSPLLEPALRDEIERVAPLVKRVGKLGSTIKAWHKAALVGDLVAREKFSAQALELAHELNEAVGAETGKWSFDLRSYLETGAWRQELEDVASKEGAFRAFREGEMLLIPPLVLRAQAANRVLKIGNERWSRLRPKVVIAEVNRRREKVNTAVSSELLESLHQVARRDNNARNPFIKFCEAYEMFCIAPGYKRENSRADFGLSIYALHRSGLKSTKKGIPFQFEWPAANYKESDVFTVIAEDGKPLRFFGIQFIG